MAAKALLRGDVVEILEEGPGTLVKVVREGGDEFDAFTVKKTDLKPLPKPKREKGAPQAAPAETQEMKDLETYVEGVGCVIRVETRPDYRPAVIAQYEADVKRPITPQEEKAIIDIPNRNIIPAEWRTTFPAPPPDVQVNYPHDERQGMWRVNYKDFARYLILNGFVLGTNPPKPQAATATV
jgi:hypothetical protein